MLKIVKKPHTLNNKLRSDVRPTMLSNMFTHVLCEGTAT